MRSGPQKRNAAILLPVLFSVLVPPLRAGEPQERFTASREFDERFAKGRATIPGPVLSAEDDHWREGFHVPGMSDRVETMTVYKNKLIVGGRFGRAGPTFVREIAAWDGDIWSPLGDGTGLHVRCSIVYNDFLIVGGSFTRAGRVAANHIAAWDGKEWSTLGSGTNGNVEALAVYEGSLIVAGEFTQAGGLEANNIAAWDGTSWSPLGEGLNGQSAHVDAVVEWNGVLVAGGYFSEAGGAPAKNIASWDGHQWEAMQGRTDSTIDCFAIYRGDLIAGGIIRYATGSSQGVARWDGSSWQALGEGLGGSLAPLALSMLVWDGKLIVGGLFSEADGNEAGSIASWDGTSWEALGVGMERLSGEGASVAGLAVYDGVLHAGGRFNTADDKPTVGIARWDGSGWHSVDPLGLGVTGNVYALCARDGSLVAAGSFKHAGFRRADRIARFDGTAWYPLGSGLNGVVISLIEYEGDIVAGGVFTEAGGMPANRVARWDGEDWRPLGEGLNDYVLALAVYDGDLVAGGAFTASGGTPVSRIARWDGNSWLPFGSGMDEEVWSLSEYEGDLIAGGRFTVAGDFPIPYIARWDGNTWSALGTGLDHIVYALMCYQGSLVVGGSFRNAGETQVLGVARWDGNAWSSVGAGTGGQVYALTTFGGDLFAGGYEFDYPDDFVFTHHYTARWDGNKWDSMGSGTNFIVDVLAEYDGSLFVGGQFGFAGYSKRSRGIARWDPTPVEVTTTGFRAVSTERGIVLRWGMSVDAQRDFVGVRVYRGIPLSGSIERTTTPLQLRDEMYFEDTGIEWGRTYRYSIGLVHPNGNETRVSPIYVLATRRRTALHAPFETGDGGPIRIRYSVGSVGSIVSLTIYDVRGRLVKTLREGPQEAGDYSLDWDRRGQLGAPVARGIYLLHLDVSGTQATRKLPILGH